MSAAWQTPIVVLAVMAWLAAPPKTLGEASQREALRRQMAGKSHTTLTNIGQPAEIPLIPTPAAPPADPASGDKQAAGAAGAGAADKAAADKASADKVPADKVKDEKYWRDRIAAVQDTITRGAMMTQALQTRINTLKRDSVNQSDPMKQRKSREELQATMDELARTEKQIDEARKSITQIQEEGRRLNVPASWIR